VAVAGGKYTTYRVMARDTVDRAVEQLPRPVPPSCTHEVPLLGAEGWRSMFNARRRLAERSALELPQVEHLLARYGTEVSGLLDLISAEPELAHPLPGAEDHLAVEVRWAVEAEGALHLDDVLTRRTRISIQTADRGTVAAGPAARLMGGPLGWTARDLARELWAYRDRVDAERRAHREATDERAAGVRLRAMDLRADVAGAAPA
jgi:glycerol-3-phosphate dehydrogenase